VGWIFWASSEGRFKAGVGRRLRFSDQKIIGCKVMQKCLKKRKYLIGRSLTQRKDRDHPPSDYEGKPGSGLAGEVQE